MSIQSTKHILRNVNVVVQTRSEVAGAGSWGGGRVKETGTDND